MKRNLLISVMVILVAAGLLNTGTFSFFTDTEITEDNIFQAGDLDLKFVGPGESCTQMISFLQEDSFQGVDSTPTWSADDTENNLATDTLDLLGYTGVLNGYDNGSPGILTHRGTRGLGIYGGENDEIDVVDDYERIEINFDTPKYLCRFEVRSLFKNENYNGAPVNEKADIMVKLEGSEVATYQLVGLQESGDGIVVKNINTDILVDQIIFYVNTDRVYSDYSDYAVARVYFSDECMQDKDYVAIMGATWAMEDMKPGVETDGTIVFNEDGSNLGKFLDITCEYSAVEDNDGDDKNGYVAGPEPDTDLSTGTTPASTDAFAGYLQITKMNYHSDGGPAVNLLASLADANVNGYPDLFDLNNGVQTLPLSANGANGDYISMNIMFHPDAGNDYQGDIFYLTMIFTLKRVNF